MNELKIQDLVLNVLTQEQFDTAEKDATQLYLTPDTSIDSSEKGTPNGVASLGSDGKVPAEQLPDALTNAVAKTGDTMTGALKVPTPASTTNDTTVPTTAWVRNYGVPKTGGEMTGALILPTISSDSNDNTAVTSEWVRNLLEQEKTKLMGIPNTKAGVAFSVECGYSGSGTQYNVPANGIIVINSSYARGNHDDIPVLLINGNNVGDPNTTASHIHMVLSGDTIGTSNASDGYSINAIKGIFFPYL